MTKYFPPVIITTILFYYTASCYCVLARDVPGHDMLRRVVQDDSSSGGCNYVCTEGIDPLLSMEVDVIVFPPVTENEGLFGRMIHRLHGFVGTGNDSKFGRFMNGFWNRVRGRTNTTKTRYAINTNVFIPALQLYATKSNSLAALIRSDSVKYTTTPTLDTTTTTTSDDDLIPTLLNLSAENMENLVSVIDSMVDTMGQVDVMNLTDVVCSMKQFLYYIQNETLRNILYVSSTIVDNSSSKSGNVKNSKMLMDIYNKYYNPMTTTTTTTPTEEPITPNMYSDQCPLVVAINNQFIIIPKETLPTSIQPPITTNQVDNGGPLDDLGIIALIILFPISIVVSIITIIFSIFLIITSIIFNRPILPDSDCDEPFCDLGQVILLVVILGLIASPILIPIQIITIIIEALLPSPSTMTTTTQVGKNNNHVMMDEQSNEVMRHLFNILELPMEMMVDSISLRWKDYKNGVFDKTQNAGDTSLQKWNCTNETETILCHNAALLTSLPF